MPPTRYVVVSRGYLSSDIDPSVYTAWNVGKDLEALPFYWPDYVVWDARSEPAPTVQTPLKYLPDAFLDAGIGRTRVHPLHGAGILHGVAQERIDEAGLRGIHGLQHG